MYTIKAPMECPEAKTKTLIAVIFVEPFKEPSMSVVAYNKAKMKNNPAIPVAKHV